MGQAPATGTVSLRAFPRNFPGRSGTENDQVYLCSPEVAVATAIEGRITDPRKLGKYPNIEEPTKYIINEEGIIPPSKNQEAVKIIRGPNIKPFPNFASLENELSGKILLKVGDNITTDDIMPAGSQILPLRSNIPAISEYVYSRIDPKFSSRAKNNQGFVIAGENYGQGSSREHAAVACRFLGVRGKIAKSFARIHRSNLINFGILPLVFIDPSNYEEIETDDTIKVNSMRDQLKNVNNNIVIEVNGKKIECQNGFSKRERNVLLTGGIINYVKKQS
jgi:aconitate hydratase